MSKLRVSFKGDKELINLMRDIGVEANKILDEAAVAGAEVVFEDAVNHCPVSVDGNYDHPAGNLKSAIEIVKPRKNEKNQKQKATAQIRINSKKAYYGTFVELGTSKAEANPFLRNGHDKNKKEISEEITKSVSDAIGKVVK